MLFESSSQARRRPTYSGGTSPPHRVENGEGACAAPRTAASSATTSGVTSGASSRASAARSDPGGGLPAFGRRPLTAHPRAARWAGCYSDVLAVLVAGRPSLSRPDVSSPALVRVGVVGARSAAGNRTAAVAGVVGPAAPASTPSLCSTGASAARLLAAMTMPAREQANFLAATSRGRPAVAATAEPLRAADHGADASRAEHPARRHQRCPPRAAPVALTFFADAVCAPHDRRARSRIAATHREPTCARVAVGSGPEDAVPLGCSRRSVNRTPRRWTFEGGPAAFAVNGTWGHVTTTSFARSRGNSQQQNAGSNHRFVATR
jgi:hypothetical protein